MPHLSMHTGCNIMLPCSCFTYDMDSVIIVRLITLPPNTLKADICPILQPFSDVKCIFIYPSGWHVTSHLQMFMMSNALCMHMLSSPCTCVGSRSLCFRSVQNWRAVLRRSLLLSAATVDTPILCHLLVWAWCCYYPSVQCQSFTSEARAIVGWFAPLGCAKASLQRPSPLFSHLGTWCVLHSSTSVHIHCSLSIIPFLIVSCLVVSSACVCVCLETPYCPCSVYNLQVGRTNSLVLFPHLQSPWCSVTQGPFQTRLLTGAGVGLGLGAGPGEGVYIHMAHVITVF